MFESGHTFDEIDAMSVDDFADVLSYWHGEQKATDKKSKTKGKR